MTRFASGSLICVIRPADVGIGLRGERAVGLLDGLVRLPPENVNVVSRPAGSLIVWR